ncbi:MAG: hypothetical protein ACYDD6_01255 [Acidimicrobiales bacterium]
MIDPDVAALLLAVPEFVDRYLVLVEQADGDPGAPAAFGELAEFAAGLAVEIERFRPVLERTMAAVESVAAGSEDAEELLGWAFFDSLSPDDLSRLDPWLGPHTRAVLDGLDIEEPPGTT